MGIDDVCISTLALDDIDLGVSHQNGTVTVGGWPMQLLGNGLSILEGNLADRAFLSAFASLVDKIPSAEWLQEFSPAAAPIASARNRSTPARSTNAKQIVITYGLFRPSFDLSDLESFAETGIVPPAWQIYLNLTGLEADRLHQGLTQKIQVDVALVDRVLNSSLGNQLLDQIGQILHTPSRQASTAALRAALVIAASNDNQISLLEFFQNYPVQTLYIDGPRLLDLVQNIACNQRRS